MSDCQAGAGFQLCGRSSAIRLMGWVAMRESTSLNQAKGSTPARWARCREAAQDGCSFATPITAEEHPIVASYHHATDVAFGGIVIDAQISVFAVARSAVQFFRV